MDTSTPQTPAPPPATDGTAQTGRFERQKRLMLGVLFGGLVALAAYANIREANLASGKPWRTSSTLAACQPYAHQCAGTTTDIFFCTVEEDNPWLEIDMQAPTRFAAVALVNRRDCCPERATPVIVEVSDDAAAWREIARNDQQFGRWRAKFAPQVARYVRVRVPRKTIFHLESVKVYP